MVSTELAPLDSEPAMQSRGDKFFGTDLERILKEKELDQSPPDCPRPAQAI